MKADVFFYSQKYIVYRELQFASLKQFLLFQSFSLIICGFAKTDPGIFKILRTHFIYTDINWKPNKRLTVLPLMPHIYVSKLDLWFSLLFVAFWAQKHYLCQWWLFINFTSWNILEFKKKGNYPHCVESCPIIVDFMKLRNAITCIVALSYAFYTWLSWHCSCAWYQIQGINLPEH